MDDSNSQPTPYEKALAEITEDLANLRANLLGKLGREVITLETQKQELAEDIQKLQAQRQELEVRVVAEQGQGLQGQSLPDMQRQQWIEQLAQAIAVHLKAEVNTSNAQSMQRHSDTIEHLTTDLDNTLRVVFQSLQRDIESYQNDLDLQMQRMHSQRQQAELLLAALIERIDSQLERAQAIEQNVRDRDQSVIPPEVQQVQQVQPKIIYVTSAPPPTAKSAFRSGVTSNWWKGFMLLLTASIVLSLQNVFLRIIFVPSSILGQFPFGGLVGSNLANLIAVLGLRMLFAIPLMWLVATQLFQIDVTRDLQLLFKPNQRLLLTRVGLSALVQFISFGLLYFAIATMKPAIATALFFTFPIASIFLNWLIFGDRPTAQKWITIAMLSLGAVLICNLFSLSSPFSSVIGTPNTWGVVTALLSGVTFAIYLLISQACYRKINPVSFTTINFAIILGLSIPFIPWLPSLTFTPGLLGMGGAIALTTVAGYVLTHFGTKLMGAAPALIFSAIVPILTSLLAFVLLADSLSLWQIVGISLISGGMVWLSLQSLSRKQAKRG
jgi:drug/metabolite transporter (DMT)-like permease